MALAAGLTWFPDVWAGNALALEWKGLAVTTHGLHLSASSLLAMREETGNGNRIGD